MLGYENVVIEAAVIDEFGECEGSERFGNATALVDGIRVIIVGAGEQSPKISSHLLAWPRRLNISQLR